MFYIGDFETTTGKTVSEMKKTRVWSAAVCTVEDNPVVTFRGTTIEEFLTYLSTLEDGDTVLFHNLKFDASFMLDYCLKKGWDTLPATKISKRNKNTSKPKLDCLISDMGTFFSLKLRWGVEELEQYKEINIWNSLLKIPMPVSKMPKTYKLGELSKGDIDYAAYRPEGYIPNAEEWDYIDRDCIIVAKALNYHLKQGQDKMTIGSDSMAEFKQSFGESKYTDMFPEMSASLYLHVMKPAYKGGFTWVKPQKKNLEFLFICCYDVNSMHPASMYNELMPYGSNYKVMQGDPREDKEVKLWIANIDFYHIRCKTNRPPCIQLDQSSAYLEGDIELEHINLTVTNVDFDLIKECYDIENYEFNYYLGFYNATTGLFCEFIDKWMKVKGDLNLPDGLRQIAKLIINNLYGKFGENFEKLGKTPYIKDGVTHYKTEKSKYFSGQTVEGKMVIPEDDKGKPLMVPYTPIAIFTCAYSRRKLIHAIIENWDRFIYCDTDSIYLEGHEDAKGIEIHKTKLGAWDKELLGERGYFIHAKCYRYYNPKKGEWTFKCAGLPERAKEFITVEDFKEDTTYIGKDYKHMDELKEKCKVKGTKLVIIEKGKLLPVIIDGGIILEESPFTIQ